jgi:hypothetical protein
MTAAFCILLFLAGALLAMLSGLSKRHRRGIEVTGHLLISACFFTYGIVSSHVLRVSPRPVVTGTVTAVRPMRSRMDLNYTTIQPDGAGPNGSRLTLHSESFAQQIQVGERVRVRYSDYDDGVLELDVLSGPGQGFAMRENDSAYYRLVYLLGGFLFLGTAWLIWRRPPKAAVQA